MTFRLVHSALFIDRTDKERHGVVEIRVVGLERDVMVPWCYRSEQSPCQYISLLSHSCQSASHVGEGGLTTCHVPLGEHCKLEDGTATGQQPMEPGRPPVPVHVEGVTIHSRRVGPYLVSKLDGIRYLFAQFLRGALMSMFSSPGPLT
mgnify:CR=1 FL=1